MTMVCPSCGAALLTLNKPCWNCHMAFVPDLECPACHQLESKHLRQCPVRFPSLLCPLCGGKRHRHSSVAETVHSCQWRQCFGDERVAETADSLRVFSDWLKDHGNDPAGTVACEKLIRRMKRDAKAK